MDEQRLAEIEAEHSAWGDPWKCGACIEIVGEMLQAKSWPCEPYQLVAEVRRLRELIPADLVDDTVTQRKVED